MRFSEAEFRQHVALTRDSLGDGMKALVNEPKHAPLFSSDVTRYLQEHPYSQYGVLGNQQSHHQDGAMVTSSDRGETNVVYGNHGEPSGRLSSVAVTSPRPRGEALPSQMQPHYLRAITLLQTLSPRQWSRLFGLTSRSIWRRRGAGLTKSSSPTSGERYELS